jgi:hypothetical protein
MLCLLNVDMPPLWSVQHLLRLFVLVLSEVIGVSDGILPYYHHASNNLNKQGRYEEAYRCTGRFHAIYHWMR